MTSLEFLEIAHEKTFLTINVYVYYDGLDGGCFNFSYIPFIDDQ